MIIGIDLGTTNSLVSIFREGEATIIPNKLGDNLTPSVVSIGDEGEAYIGKIAKERQITHPDRTVEIFKRSMGSNRIYKLGEKEFKPEELSALVLKSLKEDAENYLGEEIEEAVISVPAYFNHAQRKATKLAGKLAGLKVERIISEPTAAALAYGLHKRHLNTKFIILDLGGGTFDVSIIEHCRTIMEVRAVGGDNFLGGEDFTEVLVSLFIKKLDLDVHALNGKILAHIKKQAELCKINLESNSEGTMTCNINDEILYLDITVDEYEKACELLLERVRRPIERALKDAAIKVKEIDEIILVGGATKLKIVRNYIAKLFGRFPCTSINPDEVVALGASIQGAMKERQEEIKEMILTDVCPYTLGTDVAVKNSKGNYESGHYFPILERNTVIPASRTEQFYTIYDDQKKINITIYQGESRFAKNNVYLGEINIEVPKGKAGVEGVDVTYTYDINSILEVEVKVISTGKKERMVIQKNEGAMTEEEVEEKLKEIEDIKISPREREENKLLLARGERLYEECLGVYREAIQKRLMEFEGLLDKQDKNEIDKAYNDLTELFDELDTIL